MQELIDFWSSSNMGVDHSGTVCRRKLKLGCNFYCFVAGSFWFCGLQPELVICNRIFLFAYRTRFDCKYNKNLVGYLTRSGCIGTNMFVCCRCCAFHFLFSGPQQHDPNFTAFILISLCAHKKILLHVYNSDCVHATI